MKKLLFVVALVVIAACSNNGSQVEGKDSHETAALAGAEVGCAALAQMAALVQSASQATDEMHDASWLAGWKPNSDLQLAANF